MTQAIARAATAKIVDRLTGQTALAVQTGYSPSDLTERTTGARYPLAYVYCEKLVNNLVEKFRRFSGRVQAVVDVRVTQDRPEGLSEALEQYVDAVTDVLTQNRGDWGDGLFFTGKYEVVFTPVKHGGRNFIESAKIVLDIEVSK